MFTGQPGWSQYLTAMPLECATATWEARRAALVELKVPFLTLPNWTAKSVEAMGETEAVMLEKVELRVGIWVRVSYGVEGEGGRKVGDVRVRPRNSRGVRCLGLGLEACCRFRSRLLGRVLRRFR